VGWVEQRKQLDGLTEKRKKLKYFLGIDKITMGWKMNVYPMYQKT
jgi:hypothetical protein